MPKRYDLEEDRDYPWYPVMNEKKEGTYIEHEDYDKLQKAVKTFLATMDNVEVCGMAPALCAFKKAKINLENILEGK